MVDTVAHCKGMVRQKVFSHSLRSALQISEGYKMLSGPRKEDTDSDDGESGATTYGEGRDMGVVVVDFVP